MSSWRIEGSGEIAICLTPEEVEELGNLDQQLRGHGRKLTPEAVFARMVGSTDGPEGFSPIGTRQAPVDPATDFPDSMKGLEH